MTWRAGRGGMALVLDPGISCRLLHLENNIFTFINVTFRN